MGVYIPGSLPQNLDTDNSGINEVRDNKKLIEQDKGSGTTACLIL